MTKELDPAVAQAERVVQKLLKDFLHVDENLREFLKVKPWTTLGYATLTKLWAERFTGTAVGKMLFPLIPVIVDEMLKGGSSVEDIADAVDGVGVETVVWLKEQLDDGVEAEHATTIKPPEKKAKPVKTLLLEPGVDYMTHWNKVAANQGKDLKSWATDVLINFFDNWADDGTVVADEDDE